MFVAIIFINFEGTKVVNNDQGDMMVKHYSRKLVKIRILIKQCC